MLSSGANEHNVLHELGPGEDSLVLHMLYCTPWTWNPGWIPSCYKYCTCVTALHDPGTRGGFLAAAHALLYSMNIGSGTDSSYCTLWPWGQQRIPCCCTCLMYSVNLRLGSDSLVLHMCYCTLWTWDQKRIPCCYTCVLYSMYFMSGSILYIHNIRMYLPLSSEPGMIIPQQQTRYTVNSRILEGGWPHGSKNFIFNKPYDP